MLGDVYKRQVQPSLLPLLLVLLPTPPVELLLMSPMLSVEAPVLLPRLRPPSRPSLLTVPPPSPRLPTPCFPSRVVPSTFPSCRESVPWELVPLLRAGWLLDKYGAPSAWRCLAREGRRVSARDHRMILTPSSRFYNQQFRQQPTLGVTCVASMGTANKKYPIFRHRESA